MTLLRPAENKRGVMPTVWEHDYFDSHRVLHWDQTQVSERRAQASQRDSFCRA